MLGVLKYKRIQWVSLLVAVLFLIVFIVQFRNVQAAAPSVIINEIMYNPASNIDNDEFLELHNTTNAPIDLNGWCFNQGVTLCFASTTVLAAHGYGVVSPNAARTLATYGVTTIGTYTGKLDNGGERVTLVDGSTQVVNSLEYDDVSPWPTSPDGGGPSLELKDPQLDNSLAASWGASLDAPTPGQENSYLNISLPGITTVSDPNSVQAANSVNITAHITDANSVSLVYKINFDSDVTIPMFDDGAHNDSAANDGIYGASIPGQVVSTLVRFKISAVNNDGTQTSPSIDDSQNYHGYMVQDPNITSNAPILNWYISDADYTDMVTNHLYDNLYFSSVVVYGNDVYDNSRVRVRGDTTRDLDKKPLKFKLPKGYGIDFPGGETIALNEFNLLNNMLSQSAGVLPALWWGVGQTGLPVPTDVAVARIQKNGQFQGLYIYTDKYEKEWRSAHNYTTGELYEDSSEVVNGNVTDATRVNSLRTDINGIDNHDPAKLDYVLDNYDIPNVFNFMASVTITGSWDQSSRWNSLQYYDSGKTNRWSNLLWDIDGNLLSIRDSNLSPYDYRSKGDATEDFTYTPIYYQKSLRGLYFRRMRTIVDKLYTNNQLLNKFNDLSDLHAADQALDVAKWPRTDGYDRANQEDAFRRIRDNLLYYSRTQWAIPAAQTDTERQQVSFSEVHQDISSANEYIKISNASSAHVDISGWTIQGINYKVPQGSVVPAGGSIYILKNDAGYRATHASVLVAGQYTTPLSPSGGHIALLTDTNMEVDAYDY